MVEGEANYCKLSSDLYTLTDTEVSSRSPSPKHTDRLIHKCTKNHKQEEMVTVKIFNLVCFYHNESMYLKR